MTNQEFKARKSVRNRSGEVKIDRFQKEHYDVFDLSGPMEAVMDHAPSAKRRLAIRSWPRGDPSSKKINYTTFLMEYTSDFDVYDELRFLLDDPEFRGRCDLAGVHHIHVSGGLNKNGRWWVTLELEFSEGIGKETTANDHFWRLKNIIESKGLEARGRSEVHKGHYVFDGLQPREKKLS